MFSICLPVYRYDVRPLVDELLRQAASLSPAPEIIVFDDGSPATEAYGQEELRTTPGIVYRELRENLGRAGVRNAMVGAATRPWVLLMDADGWPPASFLETYLTKLRQLSARESGTVMVGGRTYAPSPPLDSTLRLHWHYGHQRESRDLPRRRRDGWLGFQSNNFLAPVSLLKQYPFPEGHRGYGHEDTYWGQRMLRAGVPILHLDNPVVHLGLEPAGRFLDKQREAIRNLHLLRREHPWLRTRLTEITDHWSWAPMVARLIPESTLQNYLSKRSAPNLLALDLLKLRWWHELRPHGR
ncbi:glycosyltransferase family 2 protein [Lewinella sp. W8]|uniref:glycosyltransferase family 2 protein n=1 Tax=Lewinella sp. W8 TaxID=2528208 RepID=UPI0015675E73